MFDAHIHVAPPGLPGVGPLSPRLEGPPDLVASWLRAELDAAGVEYCLAMGSWSTAEDDPLGVSRSLAIASRIPGLLVAGICDPTRNDADHLRRVSLALSSKRIHALKIYLGYLHYEPAHPSYRPYYELAERHDIPVWFHTGDTYSPMAKLKYAHPLGVDEVAVDHRKVRFVIAHCGNPWLTDAAAVVYKNVNVWADVSALVIGDPWDDEEAADAISDARRAMAAAFKYAERPNRFLFGTDWPLVGIKPYRDWVAGWAPEEHRDLIFRDNARMLLRI